MKKLATKKVLKRLITEVIPHLTEGQELIIRVDDQVVDPTITAESTLADFNNFWSALQHIDRAEHEAAIGIYSPEEEEEEEEEESEEESEETSTDVLLELLMALEEIASIQNKCSSKKA